MGFFAAISKYLDRHPQFRLFIHCSLIVMIIFADVIFKDASISMSDQANFTGTQRTITTLYKERDAFEPALAFYDFGGSAFQSEPGIHFLKDAIYNFRSPYWNPYSGAGSFGPETMVDIKFSPLSFIIAAFGASNLVFHFFSLLFFSLALFFLARVLLEHFHFSYWTTMTSCVVYLLSGYFTANLSSNTSQTYLYFPFAVFAILNLIRKPNAKNYVIAVFAYILPLSVTFYPTTIMMLTCICGFAAGSTIDAVKGCRGRMKMLVTQASLPVVAVSVLAFLYLPLFEALKYVGAFEVYGQRIFFPASYKSIISLFSAKHVFELHNAMHPSFGDLVPSEIFHLGIISAFVVTIGILSSRWSKKAGIGILIFLFVLSLGRIFAVPGVSHFVDHVPFFRNIAEQYWWMMVACPFPIIFAYSLDLIRKEFFRIWPAVLVSLVILADLIYILCTHEIVRPPPFSMYLSHKDAVMYIATLILILVVGCTLLYLIRTRPARRAFLFSVLCITICVEMNYYFYRSRYIRMDAFAKPPEYINFLKENLGLHRVAAYGSQGLPPEIGSAYQLQQIEFFTMNIFPSYYGICQRDLTTEHGWWGKDTFCVNRDTINEPNINVATLNMLSVKYMVVSKSMPKFVKFFESKNFPRVFESSTFSIYQNPQVFPRAYAVEQVAIGDRTPDAEGYDGKSIVTSSDPVFLKEAESKKIRIGAPATIGPSSLFNQVEIENYENAQIDIRAHFESPGILVLPDNWHPNWRASVDGQKAYVGKVNESFRGIALDAGDHFVEMRYAPATLSLGLIISITTTFLLGVLFILRRKVDFLFAKLIKS